MDITFRMHGITFVWDEVKGRTNSVKHGIPFEHAAEAFFDPFLKIVDAVRTEEAREAIIGLDTRWRLLYVVHLEIAEDWIRLISARKATRQEREYYET